MTYDRKDSSRTIAHEISHFLYFKKFKDVSPNIKKGNYESPHKEWILSEIVTPIILNDPRMIKIIGSPEGFYKEHRELKIDGQLLTELIQELYDDFAIKEKNFSEFIKKSMEVIEKV